MKEKLRKVFKGKREIIISLILLLAVVSLIIGISLQRNGKAVQTVNENIVTTAPSISEETETLESTVESTVEPTVEETEATEETETVTSTEQTEVPESLTSSADETKDSKASKASESSEPSSQVESTPTESKPVEQKPQTSNKTWTASNGVVVQIKSEVEDATINNPSLHSENDLVNRIAEPGTAEYDAIYEYIYGGKQGAENAMGNYDYDTLASMTVSSAGSKQSSIGIDDELNAFNRVLVPNLSMANNGNAYTVEEVPLMGLLSDSTGIQMNTNSGGAVGFRIDFGSDQHSLKIYKALTKSEWLCLNNVLKKLGYEQSYSSIYDECYNDTLPEETWSSAGNCEVYPVDTAGQGYVHLYIK